MTVVYVQSKEHGIPPTIIGKYATNYDRFQLILTFMSFAMRKDVFGAYRFHLKYSETSYLYHTCHKIWTSPFCYMLMCLKQCRMGSKQNRPGTDAAFCMSDHGLHCLLRHVCPNTLGYYGIRTIYKWHNGHLVTVRFPFRNWPFTEFAGHI